MGGGSEGDRTMMRTMYSEVGDTQDEMDREERRKRGRGGQNECPKKGMYLCDVGGVEGVVVGVCGDVL